ncbi:DUF3472 domain-containing protein [Serratia sp. 2723]|uniref:DUF3472 domain-containing protein n=1 Tax=unclassified Serratia (in: enterobacteria) TaxID=2647522 RepID=UPI003D1F70BB
MFKYLLPLLVLTTAFNAPIANAEKMWAVHVTNFTGSMPNANVGYKIMKYPITVESGPNMKKFYYSQFGYFSKSGAEGGAYYTGIQPQGNNRATAVFSVFGKGVKKVSSWCTGEADGAAGATCLINVPFSFGTTYDFTATLVKQSVTGNTWEGYMTNTTNKATYKIGSWITPSSWGLLTGKSIGFIEDYSGINGCRDIKPTVAAFGAGVGTLSDGRVDIGIINKPYAVGACKDKVPYNSTVSQILTVSQANGVN